jgi:protein-S-isoprenylcysteine O-methyltransferase Ste14
MFFRAIFAFLALPGIVAFVIPLMIANWTQSFPVHTLLGLAILLIGLLLLLWCVREFYVAGRGTLAPWTPPKYLVVSGPYRYCRNPMYVGVELILLGWAALCWSALLLLYAAFIAVAFQLRVVFAEEPWAVRTFGEGWSTYRERTPRWPHWRAPR